MIFGSNKAEEKEKPLVLQISRSATYTLTLPNTQKHPEEGNISSLLFNQDKLATNTYHTQHQTEETHMKGNASTFLHCVKCKDSKK